jgi:uncharacterized membrane protein YqjE
MLPNAYLVSHIGQAGALRRLYAMEALWALLVVVVAFGLLALVVLIVRLVWTGTRRRQP